MSYDAQDFQAKNKLTGYISRIFGGKVTVQITDGVNVAEASSAAGEADAARLALKALQAPAAEVEVPDESTDPVSPVEPEQVPAEDRPSEAEARELHPAGSNLLPPPPFITEG